MLTDSEVVIMISRRNGDTNGQHVGDHNKDEVIVEVHETGLCLHPAHFLEFLIIFWVHIVFFLVDNVDFDFSSRDFELDRMLTSYIRQGWC